MRFTVIILSAFLLISCNNKSKNKPVDQDTVKSADKNPPVLTGPDTLFTGAGTEPFWAVYIIKNDKIVYHPAEGAEINVPYVRPASTDNNNITTKYNSANDSVAFELTITKKDCTNGMSDIIYPYEVALKINAATYKGCGKYRSF